MSIADNLKRVQERIARAAERAGRQASDIRLVGVTKYVGPQEAAELDYTRLHTGFCRDITVTEADVERVKA